MKRLFVLLLLGLLFMSNTVVAQEVKIQGKELPPPSISEVEKSVDFGSEKSTQTKFANNDERISRLEARIDGLEKAVRFLGFMMIALVVGFIHTKMLIKNLEKRVSAVNIFMNRS